MSAWFVGRFGPYTTAREAESFVTGFATECRGHGDMRVAEVALASDGEQWRGHAPGSTVLVIDCECGCFRLVNASPVPEGAPSR